MPTRQGSIRLFRFAGVEVYLHWSWFLIAFYMIGSRQGQYSSLFWNALEYLTLFCIVLMHEFGHALACRQVGGQANLIVLWPLGGVAYVAPPQRPGALLWSIAAGPLVNLILMPILFGASLLGGAAGLGRTMPDLQRWLSEIALINAVILIFNMLPVYPLDGGQVLRALLWFAIGRARSLRVASVIGFFGVAVLLALSIWSRAVWMGIMTAFLFFNCWRGFQQAQALAKLADAPRHTGFVCPVCGASPPRGEFALCGQCRHRLDLFLNHGTCPNCGAQFRAAPCVDCGTLSPLGEWFAQAAPPPKL